MGVAATIEAATVGKMDYSTLKSHGLDFTTATKALEKRIVKGKSSNTINDMSIPVLAMRQLSQNLKNQEKLSRTRKKLTKQSRSLPNNLKYKQKSGEIDVDDEGAQNHPELEPHDVELIKDEEYQNVTVEKKKPVGKKPKPMLQLQVNESTSSMVQYDDEKDQNDTPDVAVQADKMLSPSNNSRISPHGTLHVGNFKVKETGIFPEGQESLRGAFHFSDANDNNNSKHVERPKHMPFGGKKDFIEVATLGSGASGVVTEAIHVPSLTLVALKMLPVYNQQKRQHVSRELQVLYKNLAELSLVDDRLSLPPRPPQMPSGFGTDDDGASEKKALRCPNILSLYNAFIDPKSGMINLVIEYMDGGSLEDLVKQGGCRDERVLADIAYQTCKGLAFLHSHKSVHRDIKPANILCSSNGIIKIADFGISKALDQTCGFANSFIGTVCYMSPERITGDIYSFPCDIWSIGLTLLAVSKGRFPLSGKETSPDNNKNKSKKQKVDSNDDDDPWSKQNQLKKKEGNDGDDGPIGGPGGYWAMIKAICDDEPPSPGPEFSSKFNKFIKYCLCKEPSERLTAKQLLQMPFITENIDFDDMTASDKVRSSTSTTNSMIDVDPKHKNQLRNGIKAALSGSDDQDPRDLYHSAVRSNDSSNKNSHNNHNTNDSSPATTSTGSPVKGGGRLSNFGLGGIGFAPLESPMTTARHATAAVVRRASKEFPSIVSPIAIGKAKSRDMNDNKDDQHGINITASREESPASARFRSGIVEETADDISCASQPEDNVVYAIRLEHLDRVLDHIAKKIIISAKKFDKKDESINNNSYSNQNNNNKDDPFAAVDDEEDDDDDDDGMDDFRDHDFHGIHYYENTGDEHGNARGKLRRSTDNSSYDNNNNSNSDIGVNNSSNNDMSLDLMDTAGSQDSIDNYLFKEGDNNHHADAKGEGHHNGHHISKMTADDDHDAKGAKRIGSDDPDEAKDNIHPLRERTAIEHHSILKLQSSYTANNHSDSDSSLQTADDKDKRFKLAATNNSTANYNSSVRSVHFYDTDSKANANNNKDNHKPNLRSRLNLKSLELNIIDDENENDGLDSGDHNNNHNNNQNDSQYPQLPKTSSYFIVSKNRSKDEYDDDDNNNNSKDISGAKTKKFGAKTPHGPVKKQLSSLVPAIDYRELLPKLNSRGRFKWQNLANQLHLPYHLVQLAVKEKLGKLMELEEEDDDPLQHTNINSHLH